MNNNKFYALGLKNLIINGVIKFVNEEWDSELLKSHKIISNCYISSSASSFKLYNTLMNLNNKCWSGIFILIINKHNAALAEYFIMIFDKIRIYYINEREVLKAGIDFLHEKSLKKITTSNKLNDNEFMIISLMMCGLRGKEISNITSLTQRNISKQKLSALKKFNAGRLSHLLNNNKSQ
ncbi:helix-turn-helix transcriptional regulator [Salmonella enterica]|nr:hypothetical protein [Salmonella enterica]EDX4344544.1 hypothetical protein [Salmonella enterica subsp. enterica serovar Javiana]EBU2067002.1 hypothetical protein [Salmonella enterica]EDX8309209.1 hypothetical protein [Salmonella enterica subsp. enterica serovar Javiana]EFW6499220.1 hypothetical protein [Salmonella enterica]